jgi:hypothetical protein
VQRGRRARVGSRFAARVHVETEEHPCIGGWLPYPAKTSISAAAEEQSSAPFLARRWRASRSRARTRSPSSTSSVPRTRRYPRPAIDAGGRAASCAELESAFRRRPDAVRRSNARRSGAQSGGSGDRVRVANPNLSARLHENGRIGRIATISGNPRVAAGERESGAVQSDSWRPRRSHAANRVGPHLSFA